MLKSVNRFIYCLVNILERTLNPIESSLEPLSKFDTNQNGEERLNFSYTLEGAELGSVTTTWRPHSKICRVHDLYVEPELRDRNIALHLSQGILREMVEHRMSTVIGNAKPYEYEADESIEMSLRRRKALARFYAQLGFSIDRYWNIKMDISRFSKSQVSTALAAE